MIYLDYNATTPVAPEVLEAMEGAVRLPGNPSSPHRFGQRARVTIDGVRADLSRLVGLGPSEVIFTSGGTEADNLAVGGWIQEGLKRGRNRVLCSAIEHPAVTDCAKSWEDRGAIVEEVPVLPSGQVDLAALETALGDDVALVALMVANNETGVIQPVVPAARLAAEYGARFHCDAVQGAGKIPIDFKEVPPDSVAISAHKFSGPNGIGALILKKGSSLEPIWSGGGQEQGMRSGSEATALILGMGAAARLAGEWPHGEATVGRLRDRFEAGLSGLLGVTVVGRDAPRLPGTSAVCFEGILSSELVSALDEAGICVSGGAACHAGGSTPSRVLLAMGLSEADASATVRFSLGPSNTASEVDEVLLTLANTVEQMREKA